MSKIKNFEELAVNATRRAALQIAEAGLAAIDTAEVMRRNVRLTGNILAVAEEKFDLQKTGKIIAVGVGKCAVDAALVLEEVLDEYLTGGVAIDVKDGAGFKKIKAFRGTHPLPSDENVAAAREAVAALQNLAENDLVIFIVSGGGSTLLCLPEEKGCLEEKLIMDGLIKAGATIQEINTLRKHLSLARGGYLAKHAYPARVVSLIFSDVPGDDLQFIASGPTVKDETTVSDAEEILKKYDILRTCGIERCGLIETPKDDKYFEKVKNILVVSNKIALEAMAEKSAELGFAPKICDTCLAGEAREVGKRIAAELHGAAADSVLLYGGETTVTLERAGKPHFAPSFAASFGGRSEATRGKGGRNQELALSALMDIAPGELILSLASDGRDNTDHAGAICDTITKEAAAQAGLDPAKYLTENNSYEFFSEAGGYILTGDTGSNVSDLVIGIKE